MDHPLKRLLIEGKNFMRNVNLISVSNNRVLSLKIMSWFHTGGSIMLRAFPGSRLVQCRGRGE